jgi:hypothetical protein
MGFGTSTKILLGHFPLILFYTSTVIVSDTTLQWVYLLLFGATAGFQVALARNVGVREVPTAMLSSPL